MSKIVFIGDSVTKGIGYGGVTASDTFARKIGLANGYAVADIINAGVSSDTSAGVLSRLNADVISHAPDVCVVCIGVNDWATGVTVSAFKSNLASIISQLKSANIKVVVFTDNMNRGNNAQFIAYSAFIDATKEEAAAANCPLIDFYSRMCVEAMVGAHTALYADMIHLSIAGHTYWANFAAKPWHAGFFLPDPVVSPCEPGECPECPPAATELQLALSDLLSSGISAARLQRVLNAI